VPISNEFGAVAQPEQGVDKDPKDENIKNLQKFYGDLTTAIAKIDSANETVLGFGLDSKYDTKLEKAHRYLLSVRRDFMKMQGKVLKLADIAAERQEQMPLAADVNKDDQDAISEMTGTGGIAAAQGGYETITPIGAIKKKGKKKGSKKTTKKEDVEDPTKYAQQPLEQNLGMSDRGQGRGNNNIDGFNTRKTRRLHEDLQGDVKFAEPDKLVTVGADEIEEPVEECKVCPKHKKKAAMPKGAKTPHMKSVGSAKTGKFGGAGIHEGIEIGDRVEIKNVIESQYKYMNGLRGKIVTLDEDNNPIRVQLDEATYGDDNGCVNVKAEEIVVIREDEDRRVSEAIELARWFAQKCGATNEKVVKRLTNEILEWANDFGIDTLMPNKEDLLPVFSVVLEDILHG
jgi:hypothetical protein